VDDLLPAVRLRLVVNDQGALRRDGRSATGLPPGASWLLGIAGQVELAGTYALQVGRLAVAIKLSDHGGGAEAAALVEQEAEHRMGAERLDVVSGVKVGVITEQHIALGVDRLQQVTASAVLGEAELTADLMLEDLKEGAAVVTTGAAIGIDEQPLQQPFLAEVLHVLERLVTLAVPYSFRHSYSLRAHKLGIDPGSVALSMGHSLEVHLRSYPWSSASGAAAAFSRALQDPKSATAKPIASAEG
jgi:hypothetical protein